MSLPCKIKKHPKHVDRARELHVRLRLTTDEVFNPKLLRYYEIPAHLLHRALVDPGLRPQDHNIKKIEHMLDEQTGSLQIPRAHDGLLLRIRELETKRARRLQPFEPTWSDDLEDCCKSPAPILVTSTEYREYKRLELQCEQLAPRYRAGDFSPVERYAYLIGANALKHRMFLHSEGNLRGKSIRGAALQDDRISKAVEFARVFGIIVNALSHDDEVPKLDQMVHLARWIRLPMRILHEVAYIGGTADWMIDILPSLTVSNDETRYSKPGMLYSDLLFRVSSLLTEIWSPHYYSLIAASMAEDRLHTRHHWKLLKRCPGWKDPTHSPVDTSFAPLEHPYLNYFRGLHESEDL